MSDKSSDKNKEDSINIYLSPSQDKSEEKETNIYARVSNNENETHVIKQKKLFQNPPQILKNSKSSMSESDNAQFQTFKSKSKDLQASEIFQSNLKTLNWKSDCFKNDKHTSFKKQKGSLQADPLQSSKGLDEELMNNLLSSRNVPKVSENAALFQSQKVVSINQHSYFNSDQIKRIKTKNKFQTDLKKHPSLVSENDDTKNFQSTPRITSGNFFKTGMPIPEKKVNHSKKIVTKSVTRFIDFIYEEEQSTQSPNKRLNFTSKKVINSKDKNKFLKNKGQSKDVRITSISKKGSKEVKKKNKTLKEIYHKKSLSGIPKKNHNQRTKQNHYIRSQADMKPTIFESKGNLTFILCLFVFNRFYK